MLDEKAYILSERGAAIVGYTLQWEDKEAPARGLRNPWVPGVNPTALVSVGDGYYKRPQFPEGYVKAWKEERDEYIKQRKVFIAEKILEEFGYDYFVQYCKEELNLEYLIASKRGCDSGDCQCHMDCTFYYKGCNLKEERENEN